MFFVGLVRGQQTEWSWLRSYQTASWWAQEGWTVQGTEITAQCSMKVWRQQTQVWNDQSSRCCLARRRPNSSILAASSYRAVGVAWTRQLNRCSRRNINSKCKVCPLVEESGTPWWIHQTITNDKNRELWVKSENLNEWRLSRFQSTEPAGKDTLIGKSWARDSTMAMSSVSLRKRCSKDVSFPELICSTHSSVMSPCVVVSVRTECAKVVLTQRVISAWSLTCEWPAWSIYLS